MCASATLDGCMWSVNGAGEFRSACVSEGGARVQTVNGQVSRPAILIDDAISRNACSPGNIEFQAGSRRNVNASTAAGAEIPIYVKRHVPSHKHGTSAADADASHLIIA